jgi:glutamine synthetase
MAGLDGITNKIEPGKPLEKNIYELDYIEKSKIKSVPHSLDESLTALGNGHGFLLKGGVFTPDIISFWIEHKRKNELNAISLRPHPYEFQLYYDV